MQYGIKWTGWDEDWKWYDASGFDNSPEIVKDFYTRYLNKPRSQTKKIRRNKTTKPRR